MSLRRLTVSNLRNLRSVDIQPGPRINIVFGDNGSGKTSLLEAINLLSLGRSFRTHRPKPIIQYEAEALTVFGEVDGASPAKIGLQKARSGETAIKVNGGSVVSASKLAAFLPILSLNADSFELLTGPPKPRRQLIDWIVFHVEPRFLLAWRDLQQCLKHRNSLLRRGKIARFELASWDQQLVALGESVDAYRRRAFDLLKDQFAATRDLLDGVGALDLSYRRGWSEGRELAEVLAENLDQDLHRGHTSAGPHRADIKISLNQHLAAEVLSRGQQKSVVAALIIAQGAVFKQWTGRQSVYLVDDLPAELDEAHRRMLGRWLTMLDAQVFVTGVERPPLENMWDPSLGSELKVFHVERGEVRAVP